MKIAGLSFSNINSLAGNWAIDFENPSFAEGLFALTGPTGSGKTSVLDAICLGLYGRTVREDPSKEHNEVMTRGTGSCHAEVTFEIDGARYRSRWSQHRASRKPTGALQGAKREVAQVETGKILAEGIRLVETKMLELTGITFDQFTRAVLLAQGQFDSFLNAQDSDRADILEKITNTGIFSRIGHFLNERYRNEKTDLQILEEKNKAVTVLTSEDRILLDEELAAAKKKCAKAAGEMDALNKQQAWRTGIDTLGKEIEAIALEVKRHQAACAKSKPEIDKLAIAESARKLDVELQSLAAAQEAFTRTQADLARRKATKQECNIQLSEAGKQAGDARARSEAAAKALVDTMPLLNEARELDKKIKLAEKDEQNAEHAFQAASQQHEEAVAAGAKIDQNRKEAEAARKKAEQYQKTHALDAAIGTPISALEKEHSAWQVLQKHAASAEDEAAEKQKEAVAADKDATSKTKDAKRDATAAKEAKSAFDAKSPGLEDAQSKKKDAEKAWTKAKAAWKEQKPALQENLALAEEKLRLTQQVADLESRREQLEDGKACPLCGSLEHPYAEGNVPVITEAEKVLRQIKDALTREEKKYDAARTAFDKAQEAVVKAEKEVSVLSDALKEAEKQTQLSAQASETAATHSATAAKAGQKATADAAAAVAKADSAWAAITDRLADLGVKEPNPDGWADILEGLTTRKTDYEAQVKAAQHAKIKIEEAAKSLAASATRIESAATQLAARRKDRAEKKKALSTLVADRKAKFGDRDPDAEEAGLREAKERDQKTAADANQRVAQLEQAVKTAANEIQEAQHKLKQAETKRESIIKSTASKWQAAGFDDADACRAARWTDEDVARVIGLRKDQEALALQLKTRHEAKAGDLTRETAKALTSSSADDIAAAIAEKQKSVKLCEEGRSDLEVRVKTDDENRKTRDSQGTELEMQKARVARWKKMDDMIGQKDGVRFKKYAQGITLHRLLQAANPHLASMTNSRYSLLWDVKDGGKLLPEIVDNDQAETRRPVSNLSGGETFLVSLALALGLSGMTTGKLQVDSLFLDEGFGTLDHNNLDRAVGNLTQLQQTQGKLIGVITHIDQLKIQIGTQIQVAKVGNGRSKLSGPGVSRLSAARGHASKAGEAAGPGTVES